MPHIDVDPDSFLAASATFGDSITTGLSRTYSALLDGLSGSSAHGGSGSGPPGWGLIASHLGGYLWPNGHQDKLHAAAAQWAQAARTVTEIRYQIRPAVTLVRSQVSPEIDDAVTVCTAMSHHLGDLSAAYNDLSTACTEYAGHLDRAHQQITEELISLLEWTAAIEAAGAVTGFFTLGAGEVAAQAAEGTRLAVTAARIVTVLEDLAAATKMINEFITRIPTRILELSRDLNPLITARIFRITTDLAANAPEAAPTLRTAEQIATNNLETGVEIDEIAKDELSQTAHGAERSLLPSRLDAATQADVVANPTYIYSQTTASGSATVYVQEISGKYNVVIMGSRGVITNLKTISESSLKRLANRYGWILS